MNIFETIIKDLKSFASKFEAALKKIFGSTTWVKIAETTVSFVAPLLETVVTVEAGQPAGAAVTAVIEKVQTDLIAFQGLITAVGPSVTLGTFLTGVQSDLKGLLAAGQITDPKSVSNITLVVNELEALVNALPSAISGDSAVQTPKP